MTIVVGTAGHIDHGKTTLLRALTGIDADRLPEERRRGMTIDVGYAHLDLDDGTTIDFVDVPGHDRLVGNMLVGAGEIDAAMLVVAADDGPRAQTLEHLALLDALEIRVGMVVVTKVDAVPTERVEEVVDAVRALLAPTTLADAAVVAASGITGQGMDDVLDGVIALRDRIDLPDRPPTLAIDRVFSVKGRGAVVTGTLRGGPLTSATRLRLLPGGRAARIRELQVHGARVDAVVAGGRTALNLGGIDVGDLHRGMVLTADHEVVTTDRLLAAFRGAAADRTRGRFHAQTAAIDGSVGRSGRDDLTLDDGRLAGIVRLSEPVALRAGDRFVVRRGVSAPMVGGVVLDPAPPQGISRRRQTSQRVSALAAGRPGARLELHGAIDGRAAPEVAGIAEAAVLDAVTDTASLTVARAAASRAVRRQVTLTRDETSRLASSIVDTIVANGRLLRDGDTLRKPGAPGQRRDPRIEGSLDRLVAALDTAMPPSLAQAASAVGCPPDGIRDLERSGRIVILESDLAYAMSAYTKLTARALAMAAAAPLTPAAFRDATGTSRKYVMAILEDLDRRAILQRTPEGHIPGPKAPASATR